MKKIILPLFSILLLFSGCKSSKTYTDFFLAMDTYMEITAYGEESEEAVESARELILGLEGLMSVTDPKSEIFALNAKSGTAQNLTPLTAQLVREGLDICSRTDGALDISVYPVVQAWGFTNPEEQYRVPDSSMISSLLDNVDYSLIEIGPQGNTELPEGMRIDLGSLAKGYAGDLAADRMEGMGIDSAILSLGGNVQCIGSKPDGSPWSVGIQDPKSEGHMGVVKARDSAVVTSGGYERYFEQDGETYWHILDPSSGYPAKTGIESVTIVSQSGTLADGLSTAVFVMGLEAAIQHYESYKDFGFIIIMEDGGVYVSPDLNRSFTLTDEENFYLAEW